MTISLPGFIEEYPPRIINFSEICRLIGEKVTFGRVIFSYGYKSCRMEKLFNRIGYDCVSDIVSRLRGKPRAAVFLL